jgi:membrane-associated phospholipid phosphatase
MIIKSIIDIYRGFKDFFWAIGYFGQHISIIYVIYLSYFMGWSYIFLFIILFILNASLNHLVFKQIFYNPRPKKYDIFLYSEQQRNTRRYITPNGMPSGHTHITAFALIIGYLYTKVHLVESILLLSITFLQRYAFGNHTFIQLLVGTIIGLILGYASFQIIQKIELKFHKL